MVANPEASERVVFAGDGLARSLRPEQVLIDMSTVGPDAVRSVAASPPHGVGMVDAPVRGSVPQATQGQLTIYAGATEAAFERVQPILAPARHRPPRRRARSRGGHQGGRQPHPRRGHSSARRGPRPGRRARAGPQALLDVLAKSPPIGTTVSGKRANVESGTYRPAEEVFDYLA
jgi:hypothetical protein